MIIKSRLLVLTGLVLLLAACVRETQPAHTGSTPDVFSRPQQPADTRSGTLPEDLAEHTDIDPDSLQLLGTQGEWSFYED
jgi:PBP1b-binding outer membrane lipoprotein LpoB